MSRYLDVYGDDALFPVVSTELGRLAIASEEILYPEIARSLCTRGAEVIVHSSSEVGAAGLTQKAIARRARAQENLCWIVSANTAGIKNSSIPQASADGGSSIVDFRGRVTVEAAQGASMVANDTIDVAASRAARRTPGMGNLLSRQRLELFRSTYAQSFHSPDSMLLDGHDIRPSRAHFLSAQRDTIERLDRREII